jgi:hypothetical protein
MSGLRTALIMSAAAARTKAISTPKVRCAIEIIRDIVLNSKIDTVRQKIWHNIGFLGARIEVNDHLIN